MTVLSLPTLLTTKEDNESEGWCGGMGDGIKDRSVGSWRSESHHTNRTVVLLYPLTFLFYLWSFLLSLSSACDHTLVAIP